MISIEITHDPSSYTDDGEKTVVARVCASSKRTFDEIRENIDIAWAQFQSTHPDCDSQFEDFLIQECDGYIKAEGKQTLSASIRTNVYDMEKEV